MSTLIWTILTNGEETISDQVDHYYTLKHSSKIDKICKKIGVTQLSKFHDHTDMKINMIDIVEEKLDEYKKGNEKWFPVNEGLAVIDSIIKHLKQNDESFGLLSRTPKEEVISELEEIHSWLSNNLAFGRQFHLCIVM